MLIEFKYGVRFKIDSIEYEIRKVLDKVYEVMNLSYNEIELLDEYTVLSAYEKGKLAFKEDEGEDGNKPKQDSIDGLEHDLKQYEEAEKEEMNRRYQVIEPFIIGKITSKEVKSYLADYPLDQRPKSMQQLSTASFYRLVALWKQYEDKRRLLPKNRGPRSRSTSEEISKRVQNLVAEVDKRVEKPTDRILYRDFTRQLKVDNEVRDEGNKLLIISEATFRRIKKEYTDPYQRNKLLHGVAKADYLKNGVSSETETVRPLEIVEIDWTPIDLLIRDFDLDETLRPTLLHAVDKHTGYPLGFHIILKKEPNGQDLKQLLLHCMMPKTYLKELYPMVKFDWTAYGRPENIRFDNAKVNDSKDFEEVCSFLNIGLQYCEVQSGFQKGTVEGDFHNMDMKVFHANEGTLLSNREERDQYDPKEKACISLRGLYKIIHILHVELMANNYNRGRRGVPQLLWEQGLKECRVHRKLPYKRQYLELLFSTQGVTRKLSPKGIELLGNFFFSDELNQLRLRLEREKGDTTVYVRYGDADLRTIYVRDEKEKRYIEAYPRPGSLENKKIDRLYPVHAELLAYKCNKNNSDYYHFDPQIEEDAYESIRQVFIEEKKEYRVTKKKQATDVAANIPLITAMTGVPSHLVPGAENADLIKNIEDATMQKESNNAETRRVSSIDVGVIMDPKPGEGIPYEVDLDALPEWGTSKKGGIPNG